MTAQVIKKSSISFKEFIGKHFITACAHPRAEKATTNKIRPDRLKFTYSRPPPPKDGR